MPGSSTVRVAADRINFTEGMSQAVMDIFANMFNERASLISANEVSGESGISSIIGFAGQISGVLCLHFDRKTACAIASSLLGIEIQAVDETVRDAMGELANMMAGGLKIRLSSDEEIFKISMPSVVEGKEYRTYPPANAENIVVGVTAGKHQFRIQLIVGN